MPAAALKIRAPTRHASPGGRRKPEGLYGLQKSTACIGLDGSRYGGREIQYLATVFHDHRHLMNRLALPGPGKLQEMRAPSIDGHRDILKSREVGQLAKISRCASM